jgi:hypothetical protein
MTDEPEAQQPGNYLPIINAVAILIVAIVESILWLAPISLGFLSFEVPLVIAAVAALAGKRWGIVIAMLAISLRYLPVIGLGVLLALPDGQDHHGAFLYGAGEKMLTSAIPPYLLLLILLICTRKAYK